MQQEINKRILVLLAVFYLIVLFGCSSAPYVKPVMPPQGTPGSYHKVESGQTLWSISRMYGTDLEEIADLNHITESASLEPGQLIFIPKPKNPTISPTQYISSDDFIWPMKGKVVSGFGQMSNNMLNKGINIQPFSNPEVVAARSGKVVFCADNFGSFGKTIIIEHGDGLSTVYARNFEVFVKVGDNIQKGSTIARAGSAGRDKNPYLHFEIRKGYLPQNPSFYLP